MLLPSAIAGISPRSSDLKVSRPREDQAYIARQAIWDRLSREVDPDRKLTQQERAVLIQSAANRLSAWLNAAKARKRAQRTA
jgi:hypothetical protein